jgi:tetratricopeptide (TPR) repeat protein
MCMTFWAPNTEDANLKRELCLRGLGYVDRALELDPYEPTNHWMRTQLLSWVDRRDEALQSLVRYLELLQPLATLKDWRETKGFFGLVDTSPEKKNANGGLEYANQTLAQDATHAGARTVVALSKLLMDKPDEAFAAAQALANEPPQPRLQAVRGAVLLRRNQPDQAVADFDAVLQAIPDNHLAAVGKASVLEKQGKLDLALAAFDRVIQKAAVDWQRFEGHVGRARVLMALKRKDEARAALGLARSINAGLADAAAEKLLK